MITKYRIYLENSMGIDNEYKVGDYVSYSNDTCKGKITTCFPDVNRVVINDEINKWYIPQNVKEIRLMTPEEIEHYKLELTANKYNL